MNIKFIIEPDIDADNYKEIYSVEITMDNGETFGMSASEDEVSYDAFRADIFEDLFMSLVDAAEIEVNIEEDDYANIDDLIADYQAQAPTT